MACPYVENPEVLLPEASAQALQSKTPTVVQNLVWAQKSRGRRWSLRVIHGDQPIELPELTLDETVDSHKATAAISVKLSSGRPGTIVFANGPAEAETLATLISGLLKNEGLASPAQELLELAELSRTHIHRDYTLAETVTSGVGFHYGPMPEILRREQERLFADGTLPILVCTATLLEGVNLPCRLLVVRGPKEGRKTPMAPQTFWNLAGRAGRLGKDKSGTVVVIDPHIEKQWPNGPPTASVGLHLDRPGTELASDALRLVAYSHETDAESNRSPVFEQALGELVNAQHLFDSLEAVEWWRRLPLHAQRQLADRAKALLGDNGVPGDLARRHSTVNPVFIGQLVRWLKGKSVEELIALSPVGPAEPNAALKLAEDMARCDRWLGSDFGGDKARNYKANLTIKWARGERLSRILDERVRWVRRHKSKGSSTAAVIRDVFKVIDEFARFKVPKYVGCYAGCISLCLREQGLTDLSAEVDGLEEQYEVGAAERTTMSLMSVGLSRTAAVEVARLIPRSEMSMIDVINWIQSANLDALDIPPVVAREARAAAEETGSYYAIGGWNDAS
ncbi:MAG: helicase-related protein [Acidobacteriota bacterium]